MSHLPTVVPIAVAAIMAVVGPLLVLRKQHEHDLRLQRLQQENTDQHAEGRALVGGLHSDVRDLLGKVGRIDERTEAVVDAVGDVREWIHAHEIRHAVDEIERDKLS
jgi:hypothetical protein